MKSNYNDIIDIILTFLEDEELSKCILISGSIVPYLISNEESKETHNDLYIYVYEDRLKFVRKRIKELSKEYLFDIVCDSKWYSKYDHGFKIKYEDTIAGFFPCLFKNNTLTIKTYALRKEQKDISLKTKVIDEIYKNSAIKYVNLVRNKILTVMSPEFILARAKSNGRIDKEYSKKTISLLNKLSDESVLKVIEDAITKQKVDIIRRKVKTSTLMTNTLLTILLVILLILTYICFKI